jgi:hypothetical protein
MSVFDQPSAAVRANTLRRMREAAENTLKPYKTEEERRAAARALGIEHYLPEPQQDLPLKRAG